MTCWPALRICWRSVADTLPGLAVSSPIEHLNDEYATLFALLGVLRQEQSRLAAGDIAAHAPLLEEKAGLVARLSALAGQRHRRLAALGLPAEESGMHQWLATSSGETRAAWDELMALARDAHEANRVNGLLLGQLQARNRQAMAALGLGAPNGLYGASGEACLATQTNRPARATG